MKLFIKKLSRLSLLFLFCGLLLSSILLLILLFRHPVGKDTITRGFLEKQEMLVQKHRQKIPSVILLGGSSVGMGFNSEILQDSLNRPVINTGLHAGSGLKFMLDHTSKYLVKGDILVIAPEYHHFFNDYAYGESFLAELFFTDPSTGADFNLKQGMVVLNNMNLIKDALLRPVFSMAKNSIINKQGDMSTHWTLSPRPYKHASLEDFKKISLDFLDYYENTVETLRNQGIEVIIIPPPFPETSYRIAEERLLPLFAEFEKRNLTFSISPQESTYADSLFFDSYYHLTYKGAVIRTNQLIQRMKNR